MGDLGWGGLTPPSGGGRFGRGLPPAAAVGQPKSRFLLFQQLAKRLCPLELHRDSVQGGAVGLKSYCTVVDIRRDYMCRALGLFLTHKQCDVETEHLCSGETGQMSAVETGQMSGV